MITSACLLGFGEVGQTLARTLRPRVARLSAWDLAFDEPARGLRNLAASLGVTAAPTPAEAVDGAQLVISAVTAAQIGAAAESVASHLEPRAWYFDLNSTSPAAKAAVGACIGAAGASFVEAAIMSPIDPLGAASPMLIGGEHAARFQPLATALGFTATRLMPGALGSASAAKMCRSVIVKGLEALVLESLLAARHHGVDDVVLESLQGFKIADWRESARYMASRALKHGVRRAEEMREVSRTVQEAGLAPHMSAGCVNWQAWAGARHDAGDAPLSRLLDDLLATRSFA